MLPQAVSTGRQVNNNLNSFIKYIKELKNEFDHNIDAWEFDEETKNRLNDFLTKITMPEYMILCGSAILKEHTKKDFPASDLDIFMTDHQLLKNFQILINTSYKVKQFLMSRLANYALDDTIKKRISASLESEQKSSAADLLSGPFKGRVFDHKLNFSMTTTSNQYTSFHIDGFHLFTTRMNLVDVFEINFIAVEYQKDVRRSEQSSTWGRIITGFPDEIREILKMPHLATIVQNFDFEELKRGYSFEADAIQPISRIVLDVLGRYENHWPQDRTKIALVNVKNELERKADFFNEKYNDPDILNVSELVSDVAKHVIVNTAFHLINMFREETDPDIIRKKFIKFGMREMPSSWDGGKALSKLVALIERLDKYQERGFKIQDPKRSAVLLNFLVQYHNLFILNNPTLIQLERHSVITGEQTSMGAGVASYKFVDSIRQLVSSKDMKELLEPFREYRERERGSVFVPF